GEPTARREPLTRAAGDPGDDRRAVAPTVERDHRLVVAGLRTEQPELVGGDVRRARDEHGDTTAETPGEGGEQVALVDGGAPPAEVASRAGHGPGVDVGGVEVHLPELGGQRAADRADAAAQVDDGDAAAGPGVAADQGGRLLDEQAAARAGDENARLDGEPQSPERRPPDDVLERLAELPARHHGLELLGRRGRLHEDRGLVLREDAPGRRQPLGDRRRRHVRRMPPRSAPVTGQPVASTSRNRAANASGWPVWPNSPPRKPPWLLGKTVSSRPTCSASTSVARHV